MHVVEHPGLALMRQLEAIVAGCELNAAETHTALWALADQLPADARADLEAAVDIALGRAYAEAMRSLGGLESLGFVPLSLSPGDA